MDTLIIIGVALAVITTLCVIVYEMAEDRGRHAWAWTLAAAVGLACFIVGWLVVAVALALAGPVGARRPDGYRETAPADIRG